MTGWKSGASLTNLLGGHMGGWLNGYIPKRGLNLVAWYIADKLPSYR